MKLYNFTIEGFRRINRAEINFGDATFLIGENNVGKSSILKALEIFFSGQDKLEEQDYLLDEPTEYQAKSVVFMAKFIDLPKESRNWRGFKGRVFIEKIDGEETIALYYKKTYPYDGKVIREMKTYEKMLKSNYKKCGNIKDFIESDPNLELEFDEVFTKEIDRNMKLAKREREKLELIPDLWDINEDKEEWVQNPGGIEGNILIRIPKFLLVPAVDKKDEIEGTYGTLQKTMKELFVEVRDLSPNYKEAQKYLNRLADELDPDDTSKDFGKMMSEINDIVSDIFKDTRIYVETNLSDPESSIKPSFEIEMSSNVRTKPERQGMGSIRSAVFALLRYREKFVEARKQQGDYSRTLIIGFEEPELYLHPNVANLMRDKIYELATSTHTKMICTTHSPYMINLSKQIENKNFPSQVLNLVRIKKDYKGIDSADVVPFNTTKAYLSLFDDEKQFVKYILKIDDYVARVFFAKHVIVVEGDTEDIVFRETIKRLPENIKKEVLSNVQIIKARGKAAIIPLVKYFKAMDITPFVIHDRDEQPNAVKFNKPILEALEGNGNRRLMLENCIEDILRNEKSPYGKPFAAFKHINEKWGENWGEVQEKWKKLIEERVFREYFSLEVK